MNRPISLVATALVICGTWITGAAVQTPAAPPPAAPPATQTGGPGVASPPGRGRGFTPIDRAVAPVPPEVAIPRHAGRAVEVNSAVKKFIDGDRSRAQPLLPKFESRAAAPACAVLNVAATTRRHQRQGASMSFVEIARAGKSICCCT